jgi:hypothetical protein
LAGRFLDAAVVGLVAECWIQLVITCLSVVISLGTSVAVIALSVAVVARVASVDSILAMILALA